MKAVLFDLGGVLVELSGVQRLQEMAGNLHTTDELWERWLTAETVRAFESGRMTPQAFSQAAVAELRLSVPPAQFLAEFMEWVRGPYPGAAELVQAVARRCVVGCLSNTNDLHWERLCRQMDLESLFAYCFPSHRTARLKPDSEAYTGAAADMGLAPADVLFLDDNRLNVAAATAAGMRAGRVDGVRGAAALLQELGVLRQTDGQGL